MRLLNDILDLSKIEAGQLDVVAEPFDLPHAIRACGKLLGPSAVQKRLGFDVDVADDVPRFVLGDGLRVRQVVLNLLGNAIKFTERGAVSVSVRQVAEAGRPWLAIGIADTGIGIAPDRQSSIFEEFVQADHSITRRYGGTGLGLAISNRLAALMGGRLELESAAGRGTTVTLWLPATIADRPVAPAPIATQAATVPTGQPARVLLAEDHEVNQLLVRAMLARGGHEVVLVEDGQAALDAVRESMAANTPFDIALMDMQMPVMDGLAATRAIRALEAPGGRRLPIVALTANAFASDLDLCREAGMDDHVAKPVSMEVLLGAVERWSHPVAEPIAPVAPVAPKAAFRPSAAAQGKYATHRARTLEAVAALVRRGSFTDEDLHLAAGLLHKLAGTAGMFGETALGDRASELEEALLTMPAADRDALASSAAALLAAA
jgi:CheY-like chemotaxis protein